MEALIEHLVNHDIYAGNLILGQSLLFKLNLPQQWNLAPGVSRPEVNAISRLFDDQALVVNGNAWYVVFDGERNWALEFAATIRPLPKSPIVSDGEPFSVSGHPAKVSWKTKRRGLPWNRHDVTFMTVTFACTQSERMLKLEFSGWCPPEGFQEILKALHVLRCH